ncbi:glyoxalase [Arsenicitalea aurantiaca]|uniref:Glyoxalase n=1 Tax=Arsenicitalea aurantiaca TaxID=1783274 RepID=A0A433XG31_9HYPH|nr:VOC family protein [Arsenicitalea aurantiaca]RUT32908.1 glyoxalase [Arsenicitalea aurantiaca]
MNRPALTGLLETGVYVTDVAKSRAFYEGLFGFKAMVADERICAFDVAPGTVFILFRREGTSEPVAVHGGGIIPPHDGGGRQHFAFSIPEGAMADWKTYLEERNVAIESEVDWPQGGRSLYFRDPDGLLVELATPGLWSNY